MVHAAHRSEGGCRRDYRDPSAGFPQSAIITGLDCAIRPAGPDDIEFLRVMLYEVAFWRLSAYRLPLDERLAHPGLAKVLRGWGDRRGDTGIVASGFRR